MGIMFKVLHVLCATFIFRKVTDTTCVYLDLHILVIICLWSFRIKMQNLSLFQYKILAQVGLCEVFRWIVTVCNSIGEGRHTRKGEAIWFKKTLKWNKRKIISTTRIYIKKWLHSLYNTNTTENMLIEYSECYLCLSYFFKSLFSLASFIRHSD